MPLGISLRWSFRPTSRSFAVSHLGQGVKSLLQGAILADEAPAEMASIIYQRIDGLILSFRLDSIQPRSIFIFISAGEALLNRQLGSTIEKSMTRRAFDHLVLLLMPLVYGLGFILGIGKYLSPPPGPRRKSQLTVGPAADLEAGKVKRVEFNGRSIYLLRDQGQVLALDATCTHFSCNVNWNEAQGCFVCPCHGGRFDRGGKAIRKPPVRPLRRQGFQIADGKIVLLDEPDST